MIFLDHVAKKDLTNVRNLYDLVEALVMICKYMESTINNLHVQKIVRIRELKGWKRMNPDFLVDWKTRSGIADTLANFGGPDLLSATDSFLAFGGLGDAEEIIKTYQLPLEISYRRHRPTSLDGL